MRKSSKPSWSTSPAALTAAMTSRVWSKSVKALTPVLPPVRVGAGQQHVSKIIAGEVAGGGGGAAHQLAGGGAGDTTAERRGQRCKIGHGGESGQPESLTFL